MKCYTQIKISENVGKVNNPHYKKLYRFYGRESGMAEADYITIYDEIVDDTKPLVIRDPDAPWKEKEMRNFKAVELQVPIYSGGKLVYKLPSLDEIRSYCKKQIGTLWPEVLRFENPHQYYVDLSDTLLELKMSMLRNKDDGR